MLGIGIISWNSSCVWFPSFYSSRLVYLLARLMFSPYIGLMENIPILDSVKKSFEITKDKGWNLYWIHCSYNFSNYSHFDCYP